MPVVSRKCRNVESPRRAGGSGVLAAAPEGRRRVDGRRLEGREGNGTCEGRGRAGFERLVSSRHHVIPLPGHSSKCLARRYHTRQNGGSTGTTLRTARRRRVAEDDLLGASAHRRGVEWHGHPRRCRPCRRARSRCSAAPGCRRRSRSGGRPKRQLMLELGPRGRDARVERERRAAALEPEDALQAGAVHPARRSRVPGPAGAPGVRGWAQTSPATT